MKPVMQTIMHEPDAGRFGNCVQATFASILELPIEQVPHFCAADLDPSPEGERRRICAFLLTFGKTYLEVGFNGAGMDQWREHWEGLGVDFYHTISGISQRGTRHMCVARNGVVVHDPHPLGGGVVADEEGLLVLGWVVDCARREGT